MLISTKTASPDAILVDCYYQYALAQISIAADAYYFFCSMLWLFLNILQRSCSKNYFDNLKIFKFALSFISYYVRIKIRDETYLF